jgi:hypothetical protein
MKMSIFSLFTYSANNETLHIYFQLAISRVKSMQIIATLWLLVTLIFKPLSGEMELFYRQFGLNMKLSQALRVSLSNYLFNHGLLMDNLWVFCKRN